MKIIFALLLALASVVGCGGGFQPQAFTDSAPGRSGETEPTPEPSIPDPTVSPTPLPTPPPTIPTPPNTGSISCPSLGGRFQTVEELCEYSKKINNSSCITINGSNACSGFGPCLNCTDPSATPRPTATPGTTPTPRPTATPGATPTPWPTPTPPGATPPTATPPTSLPPPLPSTRTTTGR